MITDGSDRFLEFKRLSGQLATFHDYTAFAELQDAGKNFQSCGFACPVWAKEPGHLAPRNREGNAM